jgi:hypothetical protein
MIELISVFVHIFLGYVFADFIAGVYHWIKDTYFGPFTPIIGKLFVWGSRLHHIRPDYVTTISNSDLFFDSLYWVSIWALPLFYIYGFTPFLITLYLTLSANDVIHSYSHKKPNNIPQFVLLLQKYNIIQSHEEHREHHTYPFIVNYCPITPYVNVILEKINLWRNLENLIEYSFGVKPREKEYDFIENTSYPGNVVFIDK